MNNLSQITKRLKSIFPEPPEIALVLGSGLGSFADKLEGAKRISTSTLPGYPQSTVEGHAGDIISGSLPGKRLICFQGRIHLYEGYSVDQIILPVQAAAELGAKYLILTNAAGGINPRLNPGSLMLITDQINLQFRRSKEQGLERNIERDSIYAGGSPYDRQLIDIGKKAAFNRNIDLAAGILCSLLGPSYETPAEVRMEMIMGADAACMSTVAEAAEAARLGMRVMGISCITNKAAGLPGASLDHNEVIETAVRVKHRFIALLEEIIRLIEV